MLMLRRWPGNVRELSNEMRRLVALIDDEVEITAQAVRSILISDSGVRVESADMAPAPVLPDLDSAIRDLERRMIIEALRACEGKVSEAASLLGVSRKGLFLKRKRLNV